MKKKKKSILGNLFKKKDCNCGIKVVPVESKNIRDNKEGKS